MSPRPPQFLVATLLALTSVAPVAAGHPAHEVWLGIGGAASSEKNIFNVASDIKSQPEFVISLGYMHNLDAQKAVGFHFYGGIETTPSFFVSGPSGTQSTTFELSTYNIGARYRQTLFRGRIAPYVFVGASLATGSIESGTTGRLDYTGVSACVGPGAAVSLGKNFMMSAELFGSLGSAKWKERPFANSTDDKFDPSLLGGTVNFSVVWGQKQ